MSNLVEIFESERLTNVSNYSGVFNSGISYQKFDFVYNTGDNLFYYAREDMVYGGGANISAPNRFSLVPDGPYTSEGQGHYIVDGENQLSELGASFQAGQIINIEGSEEGNDGLYKILSVDQDVLELNDDPRLTGSVMNVIGLGSSQISIFELSGVNSITVSEVNESPSENDLLWSKDLFFFDADYGSTVKFKANNKKHEYGNGYYILQPKNINSLTMEVDLKFKNRTNREANAIIHFLENHQGQHEKDKPSVQLGYSQGISGFRWDGTSTFHPYDNTQIQSKKFNCQDFSHSLNFENSNDINAKLRNLDSSILQKQSGLFVNSVDEYSSTTYYEKNDIVYSTGNKSFYYCSGESPQVGLSPVEEQDSWTREHGYFKDTNTDFWTREFFWKPSIGLNVEQNPRLIEIGLGAGYTQIYSDGINESLLNLNLEFNNRSDEEAYSILHFLEQRLGYLPFLFSPPSPYDRKQNFICQEWSHTYNYKNNHSISAKFEQYPFNLSDNVRENSTGPLPKSKGELIFTSPLVIVDKGIGQELTPQGSVRGRILLKNIGEQPLQLYTATITSDFTSNFSILGSQNNNVPIIKSNPIYEFTLPSVEGSADLTVGSISLNGKTIKLRKSFTPGLEGGYIFDLIEGPGGTFVQYNNGLIMNLETRERVSVNYFVNEVFILNNSQAGTNILNGGEESYIEVALFDLHEISVEKSLECRGSEGFALLQYTDEDGNSVDDILVSIGNQFITANLEITSDYEYSPQFGQVKAYLHVN